MKIITGVFQPEDTILIIRRLINHGFRYEDLSMMSAISNLPKYLEEVESEDAAITGAAAGAVAGSSVGALSSWAVSTIPGLESVFVTGFLMATAIGRVVGGYLGSLYSVRADDQPKIDIHDELAAGKILVVVKISGKVDAETAVDVMEQSNGEHVNAHIIPHEEVEANGERPLKLQHLNEPKTPEETIDKEDPVDEVGWESFPASDPPPY